MRCVSARVADGDVATFSVPGCFELPLAARNVIAADQKLDAIVALGAVIRGETAHFDLIAGECARGLMDVQLATGVPIGFGVLTTETMEQAVVRASRDGRDKGYEAAMASATMAAAAPWKTPQRAQQDAQGMGFRSSHASTGSA